MAFMRGLTFPGGQQPVVRGSEVYLRYPRIADYPGWSAIRSESRTFLAPWEPSWASDELSKGAFRRRIKRYQKETRMDSAYAFFVFRKEDDVLMGGCTLSNVRRGVTQCCAARLLDRRAIRAPGPHVRRGAFAGALYLLDPRPAPHRSGLRTLE